MAPAPLADAPDAPPPAGEIPFSRVYVRDDWFTLLVVLSVILLLSLFRYVGGDFRLTASRPPSRRKSTLH